ncbi:ABC transporter permease [Cellulomonas sp. ATA003]|uniref:ABC transporter permease n=1 Tax=Cellulomonas sp. ATA003 TaxID=3073064 RepID=UPI002873CE20|nr:ABC transporter permease [Cellulomonas sp. ATA003]WNB85372.1 ABC transporter permease [Cellulomonas sp. ATA003]
MRGNVVWMVARREIVTRMLTKANIISMVVMLVVILVGAGVGRYFLERESTPEATRVAVEQSTAALEPQISAAAQATGTDVEITTMTAEEARAAIGDDEADAPLDAFVTGDPASPRVVVHQEADPAVMDMVTAAVRAYVVSDRIGELGGDPTEFEQAMAAAVPQVEALDPPDDEAGFDGAAFGIATVMISLLLFALIGSGSMIAMGVVEEKTSRVVEILLSTIKPTQLLAGKILGIGIYGLFQVVVLGGALVVATRILGVEGLSVDVGAAMIWLVVWFLLGFLLYALLFGGFAALVSRQEDIGSVTTPLMFLLFVPFYVTMFLVPNDPDSTLVRVLSQVPFFAPFMMPVRDAFGALAGWEMPLAIAISAVTIPVLIWLAARVYQRGVLHTGGRMKLTDALRG